MINNLARERFGPHSEEQSDKINDVSKSSALHKKKLLNVDILTEKSDHANSTLMDGVSLGHEHHFANIQGYLTITRLLKKYVTNVLYNLYSDLNL